MKAVIITLLLLASILFLPPFAFARASVTYSERHGRGKHIKKCDNPYTRDPKCSPRAASPPPPPPKRKPCPPPPPPKRKPCPPPPPPKRKPCPIYGRHCV